MGATSVSLLLAAANFAAAADEVAPINIKLPVADLKGTEKDLPNGPTDSAMNECTEIEVYGRPPK